MRISSLAVLLGLSLIGCVGQVDVGSGPGTGSNPGSGSNPGGGDDGSGSGSGSNPLPDPALAGSVDKATVSTELLSTEQVTFTVTGSNGAAGTVNVTATAVDAQNAPITDWTVTLMSPTIDLPTNGTGNVVAVVKIPSDSKTLSGTIKFSATDGALTAEGSSAFTAANQITMRTDNTGGNCIYPTTHDATVHVGTKIRFFNASTDASKIITHIGGNNVPNGMSHQQGAGTAPNAAYEQTPTSAGVANWYCHNEPDQPWAVTVVN